MLIEVAPLIYSWSAGNTAGETKKKVVSKLSPSCGRWLTLCRSPPEHFSSLNALVMCSAPICTRRGKHRFTTEGYSQSKKAGIVHQAKC
jgi:hypothetical protein